MAKSPESLELSRAPFVEHLRELRSRLIKSLIAVGVGFGITWTWTEEIFQFLLGPLRAGAVNPELAEMHHRSLGEAFFVLLKTALFGSVVLVMPFLLFQIWRFVAPGLYPEERRATVPFLVASTLFFLLGGAFCYYVMLPYAYQFLLSFGTEVSTPELMMEEYLDMTTKLLLVFGLIFEMPVFATFLAKLGLINYKMMLGFTRYAFVLCFVVGAILTPPDVVSQIALATPMFGLYLISIGCAWAFGKRPVDEEAAPAEP